MSSKALIKRIEAIEKLGIQDESNLERLRFYRNKLDDLGTIQYHFEHLEKRMAALSSPDKNGCCCAKDLPEGQSGGLLTGVLNSVTGANSCKASATIKRGRIKDRERDRGGKDHEHHD